MNAQPDSRRTHDTGDIARRAYEIWEQEGHGHGQHERHWREAESQLGDNPPAKEGNAAYPNLATRERIVASRKKDIRSNPKR